MTFVNAKPRRKNAPRPAEKSAPGFLQWLRGRECAFFHDGGCSGKMEAAHLDFAGDKGMGTKVSDRYAVPMCAGHHWMQHRYGWDTFLDSLSRSKGKMMMSAGAYWVAWPGRIAWERKQEAANG